MSGHVRGVLHRVSPIRPRGREHLERVCEPNKHLVEDQTHNQAGVTMIVLNMKKSENKDEAISTAFLFIFENLTSKLSEKGKH